MVTHALIFSNFEETTARAAGDHAHTSIYLIATYPRYSACTYVHGLATRAFKNNDPPADVYTYTFLPFSLDYFVD